MEKQSSVTTNERIQQFMLKAGHACKGFRAPTNAAGAPFSTNQVDSDCAPIKNGSLSQCDAKEYSEYKALCFCEEAKGNFACRHVTAQ